MRGWTMGEIAEPTSYSIRGRTRIFDIRNEVVDAPALTWEGDARRGDVVALHVRVVSAQKGDKPASPTIGVR